MRRSKFTEEQIAYALRQAEAVLTVHIFRKRCDNMAKVLGPVGAISDLSPSERDASILISTSLGGDRLSVIWQGKVQVS